MDVFENLNAAVTKIEDAPEALITHYRGFLALLRSTTNDSMVHALADRATASIDSFAASIFANTPLAQKHLELGDERKAQEVQARKDVAGKQVPANAIDDAPADQPPEDGDKPVLSEDVPTDSIPAPDGDDPNDPPNPSPSAEMPTTGSASAGATESAPPTTPLNPNLSVRSAPAKGFANFSQHVDHDI